MRASSALSAVMPPRSSATTCIWRTLRVATSPRKGNASMLTSGSAGVARRCASSLRLGVRFSARPAIRAVESGSKQAGKQQDEGKEGQRPAVPPHMPPTHKPKMSSMPTVSPGRELTARAAAITPGMNETRSRESWRMVSVSPSAPKSTSWCATNPVVRTPCTRMPSTDAPRAPGSSCTVASGDGGNRQRRGRPQPVEQWSRPYRKGRPPCRRGGAR